MRSSLPKYLIGPIDEEVLKRCCLVRGFSFCLIHPSGQLSVFDTEGATASEMSGDHKAFMREGKKLPWVHRNHSGTKICRKEVHFCGVAELLGTLCRVL